MGMSQVIDKAVVWFTQNNLSLDVNKIQKRIYTTAFRANIDRGDNVNKPPWGNFGPKI